MENKSVDPTVGENSVYIPINSCSWIYIRGPKKGERCNQPVEAVGNKYCWGCSIKKGPQPGMSN